MPRSRGSEMAQRVSTRGPAPLRTSSSDSDPLHHRPMTDRSPKLGDRRSPRSAHSEPLNQKKLGTRIAGLETQLEQAQGELKILKDQLASAEAAKKEAQKELEKRTTKPAVSSPVPVQDTRSSPSENRVLDNENSQENETPDENQKETDVFEVPVEIVSLEPKVERIELSDESKVKVKGNDLPGSPEKPSVNEVLNSKDEEICSLKVKIEENEKALEVFGLENEGLKSKLSEANVVITSAKAKEEIMNQKLTQIEEEFKKSKKDGIQLKEKLQEVEVAKEILETEMKKLRVQTEQWRKAADAAAAILSGGVEMGEGRRVSERCGSMEKHYGGVYDGYNGFVGSPGMGDESDDGFGNGKRKGSGIRMFGDLWKKKGQK
uniref:interactor of constitutive active ROPs 4-like n=1 Tax=Erigeron canadensis TaxID=72917 RepID=UPI001CB8FCA2|nr:interactor of constitutive active ROPs 4-like [Erigeron canadensis]XP_043624982.1 interactor of constitutive active ROPs 4-like [Erigeron canadensis]